MGNETSSEITTDNLLEIVRRLHQDCEKNARMLAQIVDYLEGPVAWIPPADGTGISVESRSAQPRRVERGDSKPQDTLSRLKATSLGRLYITRLKHYAPIRSAAFVVWRYLYPLYVNKIASKLARKGRNRWLPLVRLSSVDSDVLVALHPISGPILVNTPPPLVVPANEKSYLISPHDSYIFPNLYVAELSDVMIYGGTNLVLTENYVICHDLYDFERDYSSEELHGRHIINPHRKTIRWMIHDDAPGVMAAAASFLDACAPNYAHWMTEVLPRVALFCSLEQFSTVPIVINDGLHPNIMQSLFLIVGSSREVIALPLGAGIKVQSLYFTSVAGYVPFDRRNTRLDNHSHGLFSSYAFGLVRNRLLGQLSDGPNGEWPEKIYIRRNSGIRKVVNSNALEVALVARGFVVVSPENLTFTQQVLLFSRAKIIVASSGAAMANIIFSSPKTLVYILIGKFQNTAYWYWQNIACTVGGRVRYLLGRPVGGSQGIHADFSVDVDVFLENFAQGIECDD